MTANLILSRMGYTVCSETRGVYHLRRIYGDSQFSDSVALLYCPGPVDQVDGIKFIEVDVNQVPDKAATIPKVIQLWGRFDARRIEESGIYVYTIPRTDFGGVIEEGLTYPRPDDPDRLRYAVRMTTGEVLCFN